MRINGAVAPIGKRSVHRIPVLTDLDGSEIALFVNSIVGAQPGPAVAVLAVSRGSEWQGAEISRRVIEALDPAELHGAVLIVPIANPVAATSRTRSIRDESHNPDLTRAFGSHETWIGDQLAHAITEHVLRHADAVVDIHAGAWGVAKRSVAYAHDAMNPASSNAALALALSFGLPSIRRSTVARTGSGAGGLMAFVRDELELPSIAVALGGAGFGEQLESAWIDEALDGLRGVLRHLGILRSGPRTAGRVVSYDSLHRISPRTAGLLDPVFAPADLMLREIQRGELLARIWSPYTFAISQELRAPVRGLVAMAARSYPVRPGDDAYAMVDLDDPGTVFLDTAGTP